MPGRVESRVHRLINRERKKRGLRWAHWDNNLYRLAKNQSNKMARTGHLFHSDLSAIQRGENCWMGKGYSERALPKAIVDSWMKSHAGHRENLLDPRARTAAIAISKSRHGTFAAWTFSDQPLHKPFKLKLPSLKFGKVKGGEGMLRLPVKIILICVSALAFILGAHGLYVYFSPIEAIFGGGLDKLFLEFELPLSEFQSIVEWMSVKGIQSWFIPAVFILMGIIIWSWSQIIVGGSTIRNILKKLRLW